ncbi:MULTISPECIES: hypothetical protein [Actinomadura]|uniref:HEAT repeat domain-containing protein n=1 Tax=Actinomadura geliboluensis TaxID=882440 RepID=A0A5S4HJY7_9ACTN|nr:hypothetical protein [Actinomadura geliboluensis]TMR40530.1 hypothetical protein ETD96_10365 [Actinomadura geliboluensis]
MTAGGLEGVDDVGWASLRHAYGAAEDFPQTLRDAVGDDDERAGDATEHLFGSVYHQGTLYTATPWAVPFVARLAADPGTRRRDVLVSLLGAIAAADDATPEVLADVRAALAREAPLMVALLDDPDTDIRDYTTYLLGHLPDSCAAEVLPALRARRKKERSPLVLAGLLAAAGRLDPRGSAAWLAEEVAGRSAAVRAGALWAIAANGLPWTDAASEAAARCWLEGEPLKGWIWADDPFDDIAGRIDGPSFAALARTLLDQGPADSARTAVDAAYQRCVRSRSARAEAAPVLAAGLRHSDLGVRVAAATAIRDVREAAVETADALAALAAEPPADADSLEARVFDAALETLIGLGDTRWREPFIAALGAGAATADAVSLLIDTGVPADAELLAAVRRRLAAIPLGGPAESGGYDAHLARMRHHNEVNGLTRLLHRWGPGAAEAVPELLRLVPHDNWWTARALAAIGPAASAAVPALTSTRDDPEASWRQRLDGARALAAITGDTAQLTACIAEAATADPVLAAQTAVDHELPLDDFLPVLRALADAGTGDDPSAIKSRLEAAGLLLRTGDKATAIQAAADAIDRGRHTADAMDLAGLVGPDAAPLLPRLRKLLGDRHSATAAALAIRRITGDSAPLLDAVRRNLPYLGAGPWLDALLRELGTDAAPLVPDLRELVDGDAAIPGVGVYGRQVRQDEEERRELLAILPGLTP